MSIEDRIRERVLAELDLTENLSDVQILEEIRREICLEGKRCALSYDRRKELERHIFHSLRRLDILQDFLEDEDITEIMVNGPSCIFLERQGRIERSKRQFYSAEKLQDVIQQDLEDILFYERDIAVFQPLLDLAAAGASRRCIYNNHGISPYACIIA